MTLEWKGMGKEWNKRVLSLYIYRDSTWLFHSDPIRAHSSLKMTFSVRSSHQNGMMLEWRNDGRMTGISEFSFFLPLQKQLHSSSFRHSNIIPTFLKWKGMIITIEVISFKSHSSHLNLLSSQSCHPGITEWWGMKGDFWTKAKALIQKITSFHCHSVIPCHCCILHRVIPFIWRPFLTFAGHSNSDVIPVPFCHL